MSTRQYNITSWNAEKGFGFATADRARVFVHVSTLCGCLRPRQRGGVVALGTVIHVELAEREWDRGPKAWMANCATCAAEPVYELRRTERTIPSLLPPFATVAKWERYQVGGRGLRPGETESPQCGWPAYGEKGPEAEETRIFEAAENARQSREATARMPTAHLAPPEALEAVAAWARKHGICPEVRVTGVQTITGSYVSEDEMGTRSSGYNMLTVTALGADRHEIVAQWPGGSYGLGADRPNVTREAHEAAWRAIGEAGPLPTEETVRVLAGPVEHLSVRKGETPAARESRAKSDTKRAWVVEATGPEGRYVEAWYTFPGSTLHGDGIVIRHRLLRAAFDRPEIRHDDYTICVLSDEDRARCAAAFGCAAEVAA